MILNSEKNYNTHIRCAQLTLCMFSAAHHIHVLVIRHMLEKKWEQRATVSRLLIDFKKMCEYFKMEILYSILIEFGVLLLVFG
jgi:hypothetical protein